MTTLYRPVLIESVEQAEALPVGTVLRHESYQPIEKWDYNGEAIYGGFQDGLFPDELVGWLALVPIEAGEEWQTRHEGGSIPQADEAEARASATARSIQRRYTTEWEDA